MLFSLLVFFFFFFFFSLSPFFLIKMATSKLALENFIKAVATDEFASIVAQHMPPAGVVYKYGTAGFRMKFRVPPIAKGAFNETFVFWREREKKKKKKKKKKKRAMKKA
eukprot:TRINITY_DN10099_c0_g2_i2.p2 TRINITY_DN10099_c0_g2~~TRINITY_DN10099_c0_g2_i2.p2  ORF type:complete len:109 (-),score=75.39 TRINITY_DN10099_c0_g2_i2:276-602(-)